MSNEEHRSLLRHLEVKFLANLFQISGKLRELFIGPEKIKTKKIEKYIEVTIAIGQKTQNILTLTENEFLSLVESQLKEFGLSDWNLQTINKQPAYSDQFSYVSLKKDGGYNLWLQIQDGQTTIFCQRSPNIRKEI